MTHQLTRSAAGSTTDGGAPTSPSTHDTTAPRQRTGRRRGRYAAIGLAGTVAVAAVGFAILRDDRSDPSSGSRTPESVHSSRPAHRIVQDEIDTALAQRHTTRPPAHQVIQDEIDTALAQRHTTRPPAHQVIQDEIDTALAQLGTPASEPAEDGAAFAEAVERAAAEVAPRRQ